MTKCGGLESRRMNSNPPSRLEKLNLKPVVMKAETQFALRIPKGFVPQDLAAPAILEVSVQIGLKIEGLVGSP